METQENTFLASWLLADQFIAGHCLVSRDIHDVRVPGMTAGVRVTHPGHSRSRFRGSIILYGAKTPVSSISDHAAAAASMPRIRTVNGNVRTMRVSVFPC